MEALINFITAIGVFAVIAVVYAESGLLVGFFLPGDSLLFTAGFMVQQGAFDINIHLFVFLLWIAAALGDSTGYAFGHKVGRKLFEKENSRFFKRKYLLQAEAFFEKHGSIAIVLARFVPIVRTFTPIVAGTSKMHYHTFVVFNVVGGLLWTALFTYLGFFLGKVLTDMGFNIEIIALIIIILSVMPIAIKALDTKEKRRKAWQIVKTQFQTIFSHKKSAKKSKKSK